MKNQNGQSITRELFRYANVKAPRILDIEARLKKFPEGRELLGKSGKGKLSAANEIIKSGSYIDSVKKLAFDYFSPLDIDDIPEDYLPSGKSVVAVDIFKAAVEENAQKLKADIRNVSLSLYAAVSLGKEQEAGQLSRLLQFIEAYPSLDKRERRIRYAPVVTRRYLAPDGKPGNGTNGIMEEMPLTVTDTGNGKLSSREVLVLWDAANNYRKAKEREITDAFKEINSRRFVPIKSSGQTAANIAGQTTAQTASQFPEPPSSQADSQTKSQTAKQSKATPGKQSSAQTASQNDRQLKSEATKETTRQFKAFVEKKKQELAALTKEKEKLRAGRGLDIIPAMIKDKKYLEENRELKNLLERHENDATPVINELREEHADFKEVYEEANRRETETVSLRKKCVLEIHDPCLRQFATDYRRINGQDNVRPLGEADLIVVEESWLKYTPGEISSVETVLKNEKRVKTVKTETMFETMAEFSSEEVSETESESKATTGNELSSQIESEINTRFESEINSSVSGSGGGTIGVVNFKGEGTLGTSVGIGMDSSYKSSESSDFSSEIINRALEKTKKTTVERRTSKTVRKYETTHNHEIDNTGSNSNHINGIYCYLDKHICITERQYGIRQFLIADVNYPGRDLLVKEMHKYILNLNEVGLPPEFDIGPSDIDEYNYLSFVGRYRAFNVSTPPPVLKLVSKTYKTDTSNENKVQNESQFKNVVDILVPFFGQYKRFLIQDNIEIPEGYLVQEVHVTVTHGSNGVSIPAHLPFTLGGALIYAMPKLMISSIPTYALFYLPIALAEIVYLASPVLHYNADSSNCTINIGHETQESPYFFFQPEELLLKISNLASGFPQLSENVVAQINDILTTFLTEMPAMVNEQLVDGLQGTFNDGVAKFRELTDVIKLIAKPVLQIIQPPPPPPPPQLPPPLYTDAEKDKIVSFFTTGFQDFKDALQNASIDITKLFKPLEDLIDALKGIIENELLQSFFDELQNLFSIFENSDHKTFSSLKGYAGNLPVSLNCVALKPGVTVNLTAVMVRAGDSSLDTWRMETFDRLSQAYYQMTADYEAKMLMKNRPNNRNSPGIMRIEEGRVIKDRVIRSLERLHSTSSGNGPMSSDHYKLFEHAIDWDNFSYRLYNYGPRASELVYEKLGLYKCADERRKAFMNALWAQVLIPLKADEQLESFMMGYIQTGEVKTLDDLIDEGAQPDGEIDEIAAIYRDIILRRQQLAEEPVETHRKEIIPT